MAFMNILHASRTDSELEICQALSGIFNPSESISLLDKPTPFLAVVNLLLHQYDSRLTSVISAALRLAQQVAQRLCLRSSTGSSDSRRSRNRACAEASASTAASWALSASIGS